MRWHLRSVKLFAAAWAVLMVPLAGLSSSISVPDAVDDLASYMTVPETCASISCQGCYKKGKRWCGLALYNRGASSKKAYHLGACIDDSEDCTPELFGSIVAYGGVVDLESDAKIIEDDDDGCLDIKIPVSIGYGTCEKCVGRDDSVWCRAKVTPRENSNDLELDAGFCIPACLSYACNDALIRQVDPNTERVNLSVGYAETVGQCGDSVEAPPLPEPKNLCSENLSCSRCRASNGNCTWCQGVLYYGDMMEPETRNIMGKCVGADEGCDDLQIGNSERFPVMAVDVQPVEEGDTCSSVEWPAYYFANTCSECLSQDHTAWCSLGVQGYALQQCVTDALGFMCNLFPGDSKLRTAIDEC